MKGQFIGCIGTQAHGCQCLVKVTSSCDIASQRIQGLLEAYFKMKVNGEQEKESII